MNDDSKIGLLLLLGTVASIGILAACSPAQDIPYGDAPPTLAPVSEGALATPSRSDTPVTASDAEAETALAVFAVVNARRAGSDLGALAWDSALAELAQAHSIDMASGGALGHIGSDGRNPADRKRDAGFICGIGENVAVGPDDAKFIVEAWMASEGHRENILGSRWAKTGVGVSTRGDTFYTQVFCTE